MRALRVFISTQLAFHATAFVRKPQLLQPRRGCRTEKQGAPLPIEVPQKEYPVCITQPHPESMSFPLLTGDHIPAHGLGTWKLGIPTEDAVVDALKLGYRHLDCAADYGNEQSVGRGITRAIKEGIITSRRELWVTSKLWNTYHASEHVELALKKTLSDLGLEYLDLYLIHFPIALAFVPMDVRYPPGWVNPEEADPSIEFSPVSLQTTWKAMEECVAAGHVRNIGLCNVKVAQIWDVLTYAKIIPTVIQIERHIYNQQNNLVKFCRNLNIVVTAYSPFGGTGYVDMGLADPQKHVAFNEPIIKSLAEKYKKSEAQVMLRWLLQTGCVVIPKSSTFSRLQENMDTYNFELDQEDISMITSLDKGLCFNNPAVFMPPLNAFVPLMD